MSRRLLVRPALFLASLLVAAPLAAQLPSTVPPKMDRVKLSGPRFGVTVLGGGITDSLAAHGLDVAPVITQFGWQFERQFYSMEGGPAAVSEWVLLVGVMEQGAFLPSLSWLVGLRTPGGTEFGLGPNLSVGGASLAFAGGSTTRVGALNVPFNVAVVPSRSGVRVSMLAGFTSR